MSLQGAASAGSVTRTATLTSHRRVRNVAVGSTGSAAFPIGTRITLIATNQRDVIWSGACSSGGQKVKTRAFTLNGPASVTAIVQ
jgi:hypothetical protein